jgi:hypothetical protein
LCTTLVPVVPNDGRGGKVDPTGATRPDFAGLAKSID